ncbi:phosphatidylinositol-4-phosphate phosphatase [Fragilaria crotonensis]|nr:phosphatidylinositol-4-phosphate phosphatase [Fragilaria crotonensis]
MEQRGVLRTNCIDCLDRTNVAQFSAGVQALEQQLIVMGIRSSAKLDPSSTIIRVLIDMYVEIGDHISLQYGGSEAHKKVNTERSDVSIHGPMGKHKELLTSIRRYYSNAFTDRLKQDAMNLLLGYYIPYMHAVPLWEMETDYYLHNLHVKAGRGTLHTMRTYEKAFGVDWCDEDVQSDREDSTSSASLRRAKLVKIRAFRRGRSDDPKESETDSTVCSEPWKIARVRRRLKSQTHALSVWWRSAIQAHIKQRMWIQLGKSPTESLMPPRFDRIYQP